MRDIVDITDAVAQDAMKRAIEIDALSDLELQAASQINQNIQNAAPGLLKLRRMRGWSVPMLTPRRQQPT